MDALSEWNARTAAAALSSQAAEIEMLKKALGQIADLDGVDAALDPEWAINVARAALTPKPDKEA